jgi:hypothetical protein
MEYPPKKVPAERIDTMRDWREDETASWPGPMMASMNSLEARTPAEEMRGKHARNARNGLDGALTVDVTRIITEEDTTKRRERAHEVGLDSDRGLDRVHVGRGLEG